MHGDAWSGNIVVTATGQVVFLDLERTAIGPPEWDLVHTAIKHHSFGLVSRPDYTAFCNAYGADVTDWVGYPLFRDIRELRMTTMAAQLAAEDPRLAHQAAHRIECLRGLHGPRPWPGWSALP